VRATLPLLGEARWYERVKRGYARGWEPVQFVDRIQRYLTLLEWQPEETRATVVTPSLEKQASGALPSAPAPVMIPSLPVPAVQAAPPAKPASHPSPQR
jgi:hypothetical protein